jgi:FdhE protein
MNSPDKHSDPPNREQRAQWIENWIKQHPYLSPVACFQRELERAAAETPQVTITSPKWQSYVEDYRNGIPLLKSDKAQLDLAPAAAMLRNISDRLVTAPLVDAPLKLAATVNAFYRQSPEEAERVIRWAVSDESNRDENDGNVQDPGFQRLLAWTAIRWSLFPIIEEFADFRNEDLWMRGHCPTCGAAPAMAELVEAEAGRERRLVCALCQTRWRYKRLGCPFCGNEDPNELDVLEIEQEPSLRIDVCDECSGYLKTCIGSGLRDVLLQDWPTLHLDVAARQQGLERKGISLYKL